MTHQQYIESVNAARQHSFNYYVLSQPTVSDAAFDRLVADIEQAEREHPEWTLPDSPTQQVGSDLSDNGRRLIRHRTPMLSCQKAQTTDKVTEWMARLQKRLGTMPAVMLSWKADGISCSLVYQDGWLQSAATRGDKMQGQDILTHVCLMPTVPQHIPQGGRVEVRGEIVCPKAELARLNADYKDYRSAASGLMNQQHPTADNARLEFWAWDVIADGIQGANWQGYMPQILSDLGFEKNCYHVCDDGSKVTTILELMTERRSQTPIPVDGVVIRINSNDLYHQQGYTDHHPKGSIAFKFPPQTTTSRVRRIEITVGATGRRTPVAYLEPVTIMGRTIEKASLGSEAKMQELGVAAGCTVEIGLSNDVTPKIYRVTQAAPDGYVEVESPSSVVVAVSDKKADRVPSYIGPTVSPADIETTQDLQPVAAGQTLNVVISGCFTTNALDGYGRNAARDAILSMGHNVKSNLSRTTDYLVIGTADVPGRGVGPSKLAQAKQYGIPVVSLEEFKRLAA